MAKEISEIYKMNFSDITTLTEIDKNEVVFKAKEDYHEIIINIKPNKL